MKELVCEPIQFRWQRKIVLRNKTDQDLAIQQLKGRINIKTNGILNGTPPLVHWGS